MALQLQREIRSMMEMLDYRGWVPALVSTQAVAGTGIDALWESILRHVAWLRESGRLSEKRRTAFAHRVRQLVLGTLEGQVDGAIASLPEDLDPYAAAQAVMRRLGVEDAAVTHGYARPGGATRATVKGL
jgi:LAO/AO transport system kinase